MYLSREALAWTPVRSLEQASEVIREANHPDIGVLVGTFMVYAGGGEIGTIRGLDPDILATVHLTDTAPRSGEVWSDEDRYTMPGDGIVPVKQIIHAVLDTGYDRVNTDETSPERYQSRDRARIAKGLKAKGDEVLASL